jgi:hypothetical protein
MQKLSAIKWLAWAHLPPTWDGQKDRVHLLTLTALNDFPVMRIECGLGGDGPCLAARQCFVENMPQLLPLARRGLAVDVSRREILIGDSLKHRIMRFKYHSCFHISYLGELKLPPKLKEITNLFVDVEDRLWVSTKQADDYHNATIYFWDKTSWN